MPSRTVSECAARPAELNPHEARIARLVAEGHSNRRIGEMLGVSARAVEHHLTRVYRKLHIAGRSQLSRALGAGARPATVRPLTNSPGTIVGIVSTRHGRTEERR